MSRSLNNQSENTYMVKLNSDENNVHSSYIDHSPICFKNFFKNYAITYKQIAHNKKFLKKLSEELRFPDELRFRR